MAGMMLVDSCVLVDLARAVDRNEDRMAPMLRRLGGGAHVTSVVVVAELAYGTEVTPSAVRRHMQRAFCRLAFEVVRPLPIDVGTAEHYARIAADLRRRGKEVPANDLWIAATALQHDAEVLTSNVRHFAMIEGLRIRKWMRDPFVLTAALPLHGEQMAHGESLRDGDLVLAIQRELAAENGLYLVRADGPWERVGDV